MQNRKSRRFRFPLLVVLSLLLLAGGLLTVFLPILKTASARSQAEAALDSYRVYQEELAEKIPAAPGEAPAPGPFEPLQRAMEAYNQDLLARGQNTGKEPWDFEGPVPDFRAYGWEHEALGVLRIPALDFEMPVFPGATREHLYLGAAWMAGTSLPAGGESTNTALALHRQYLPDIDSLAPGDLLCLDLPWGTLEYRVCALRVVRPSQVESVTVVPGRDRLTLVTCHPRGSGGKYRLLVVGERQRATELSPEAPTEAKMQEAVEIRPGPVRKPPRALPELFPCLCTLAVLVLAAAVPFLLSGTKRNR